MGSTDSLALTFNMSTLMYVVQKAKLLSASKITAFTVGASHLLYLAYDIF